MGPPHDGPELHDDCDVCDVQPAYKGSLFVAVQEDEAEEE